MTVTCTMVATPRHAVAVGIVMDAVCVVMVAACVVVAAPPERGLAQPAEAEKEAENGAAKEPENGAPRKTASSADAPSSDAASIEPKQRELKGSHRAGLASGSPLRAGLYC
jgi:hypothetical protein